MDYAHKTSNNLFYHDFEAIFDADDKHNLLQKCYWVEHTAGAVFVVFGRFFRLGKE